MNSYKPIHKYSFNFPKRWNYFETEKDDTPLIERDFDIKWSNTHNGVRIHDRLNDTSFTILDAPPILINYNDKQLFCSNCAYKIITPYSAKLPSFKEWVIIMRHLDKINNILEANNKMPIIFNSGDKLLCNDKHDEPNKAYVTHFYTSEDLKNRNVIPILEETFIMTPHLTKLIIK